MRDRMEKFALIPFSFGCDSDTSVEVSTTQLPEKKYTDSSVVVTSICALSLSLSISTQYT